MLRYDNTHIFTGYLKQLLSSINIPTCKIYTRDFARYLEKTGKEDPRVLESFDTLSSGRASVRVNYLKDNMLYNYFWTPSADVIENMPFWRPVSSLYYDSALAIPGLTRVLKSPGHYYDTITHEYLGEYLRFLRDYHNINLLSMYNCFNNKLCNNIFHSFFLGKNSEGAKQDKRTKVTFNSQNSQYRIYAIPVKLFANYTIAVDSTQGVEMFCGLYNTSLDGTGKGLDLNTKTYKRISQTFFGQPFLYEGLDAKYWSNNDAKNVVLNPEDHINTITCWDIANREQDLRLFIKIPTACTSSIVILEGDFRHFNDCKYELKKPESKETWVYKVGNNLKYVNKVPKQDQKLWVYEQNHSVLNFNIRQDKLNDGCFVPISKLQLLALNTGESYPFADRLIEYLCGSAITPIDEIPDNIKRAQRVMSQNQHYFKIEGLWEEKMQKIIYDYIMNAGPFDVSEEFEVSKEGKQKGKLIDMRQGYQKRLGHTSKSTLYDILGYVDRDAEKWYATWGIENDKPKAKDSIQNVDIYDGLYDI